MGFSKIQSHTEQLIAMRAPHLLCAAETKDPYATILGSTVHEHVQVQRLGHVIVVNESQETDEAVGDSSLCLHLVQPRGDRNLLNC